MLKDFLHNILPTKKTLIAICSSIFIIAVASAVWFFVAKKGTDTLLPAVEIPVQVLKSTFETDSDQDGVSDWEEALWTTDPTQKDTDGDGVSDGAFIAEQKQRLHVSDDFEDAPTSESERFERQLYATIAYLDQMGQLTPAKQQEITDTFTAYIMQPSYSALTKADLLTVSNTDESVREYSIHIKDFIKTTEFIPAALPAILQSMRFGTTPSNINETMIIPYGKSITRLKNIPVPEKFTNSHLALLNAMIAFKTSVLDGLPEVQSEPLLAFRSVAQFKTASKQVFDALAFVRDAFGALGYQQTVDVVQ